MKEKAQEQMWNGQQSVGKPNISFSTTCLMGNMMLVPESSRPFTTQDSQTKRADEADNLDMISFPFR
jgi:hypothetical protein